MNTVGEVLCTPQEATGWLSRGAAGTAALDANAPFVPASYGQPSSPPRGSARLAPGAVLHNRGLGGEGLPVASGKALQGFIFARAAGAATMSVSVALVTWHGGPGLADGDGDGDGDGDAVLAEVTLTVPHTAGGRGGWHRLNFTLTPTSGTNCTGLAEGATAGSGVACAFNTDRNPAHVCVRCGAAFRLSTPRGNGAAVHVGFASMMLGAWGLYAGLPVRAAAAAALQALGVG